MNKLIPSLVIVSTLALSAACGGSQPTPQTAADSADLPTVAGAEARQLVADGALLLDVSPASRFEQTRIEGAVNIPFDQVEGRLEELPRDRPILVYCGRGRASPGVTRTLRERGFDARLVGARANYFAD